MAVFDNINKTSSPGVAPSIVEYYDRALLENMKPELVHLMDAQKRPLPEHNGKTVVFRRFTPFKANPVPLAEGVTPDGKTLEETALRATIKSYGDFVAISDEMQWALLDNTHQETAQLLSDQAALTLDTIAREAMNAGLNVQYAGGKAARAALTAADKVTYAEIKKAVRTLKRNNVKPCSDGFYHAIVHPDVVHDLTSDPMWVDVAKYQDKQPVQQYELGCIYKVKFFESTNAKVYEAETAILPANNHGIDAVTSLTVKNLNKDTRKADYTVTLTPDQAIALTGKMVQATVSDTVYPLCIEHIDTENKKITLRWVYDALPTNATGFTLAAYGGASVPVYSTLIYGANAYGTVELGGRGQNAKTIIKLPGSSGAEDPLDQRGTLAWKVEGFIVVILQDDFIVRLESGASA